MFKYTLRFGLYIVFACLTYFSHLTSKSSCFIISYFYYFLFLIFLIFLFLIFCFISCFLVYALI